MRLNRIINISALCLLTAGAVSCNRYLDTEPLTDKVVSSDAPLKDAKDAEDAMTTMYSQFGNEYWQLDNFFNGDGQTDVAYAGGDNVQNFQIDEYRILATNTNVSRDWNYLNGFIYNANIILNYVDGVTDSGLSTARKNEMKAEASIIRALDLFHMVQLWGDVPVVTKAVTSVGKGTFDDAYTQIYPKRQPVADVYNAIIADLEGAVANAPASSNKFRANKGAAYALLAKVYATKPNPDWAKVKQYCDLVASQGYSLVGTYDNLFDGKHEANSESIFEADGNGGNVWAWGTFMFQGTDWKKFNTPSNDLVKTFTDQGDTQRMASSVTFSSVNWADNYWPSSNFPFANKMRQTDGQQNFYVVRYADILLLKAEALARTGDLAGSAALVNQVRARVGLGAVAFTSADDAINKILLERKMELAFEGQRWFDLKRTGKAVAVLSQQKDGKGTVLPSAANINEAKLLWPIPQNQLDKNQNLTQNPGY